MKAIINILTAVALCGTLSGCHHKDLVYEVPVAGELEVVFDWQKAPEANPASMALYMFDTEGETSPLRYIFDNKTGGAIRAPFGRYAAICLNSDNSDWAYMRNTDDIDNFEIYTGDVTIMSNDVSARSEAPRASGTEDQRLVATPGMVWGSRSDDITVADTGGKQVITLYPEESICRYTVDVMDIENATGATDATVEGTLSGMAEGFKHGQGRATDTPVTMLFNMAFNGDRTALHAEYLTFGECPDTKVSHMLTVYVLLSDGTRRYYTYDVTSQVTDAPDPHNVHIIVKGMKLPEPLAPANGFIPEVNDWQTEDVGLDMTTDN